MLGQNAADVLLPGLLAIAGYGHVSTTGNNLRGIAIDSSGAMWYVSDGSDYAVVQTLGLHGR